MRLADFIESNVEPILAAWETFARGIAPGARMDALALRDHASDILLATVKDMRSTQTRTERSAKAKGRQSTGHSDEMDDASEQHAVDRLGSGFDLEEVVSEYRALRASVLELWRDSAPAPHETDVEDITRFNESIDQSVAKAVSSFTKRVEQSRNMFMAILSHDLRNPLNAIAMSTALLRRMGRAEPEAVGVVSQIATSASLMTRMISDLLDYTRTRLGAGMPVHPGSMDLGTLAQELFNEFRSAHPERTISYAAAGDLTGDWDVDRVRQAISNLLGNAIQHSPAAARIALSLTAEPAEVIVTIHNEGPPIPPGEIPRIFDPLVRGSSAEHPRANRPGSIGLGLYIAREIASSHGGTVRVISTEEAGTAFIMRLPRHYLIRAGNPILDEQGVQNM